MCRQYSYGGSAGRGREYAYLHEEEPPSSLDIRAGDDQARPDSGGDTGPLANGDGVPFVSLNDIGDHSGSFHPSGSGRLKPVHARARSIDINTETDNTLDEDVTTNKPEHEEQADNAALDDTFAATVVEVDADDYVNNTELYKLLAQRSGSVMEKRNADE